MKDLYSAAGGTKLQQALDRLTKGGSPGFSVHISVDDGDFTFCSGVASTALQTPITKETRFPIACMIKPMLGFLILSAHVRGELDIDTPIDAYCPELKSDHPTPITIRHLLSHTAGYCDPVEATARWRMTWEQFSEFFRKRDQMFEPGSVWNYTHSGHSILAQILERVAGVDPLELIRESIFTPLGISTSTEKRDHVFPHKIHQKTGRLEPFNLPPERGILKYTLSDIYLTPGEMARLGRFFGGSSLSDSVSATALAMLQAQYVVVAPVTYAARAECIPQTYGLGMGKVRGLFAQNGSFIGTTSAVRYDPESGVCIVVSTNSYEPYLRDQLCFRLMASLARHRLPCPPPSMLPFDLKDLKGVYKGLMMGMGDATIDESGLCEVNGPAGKAFYMLGKSADGFLKVESMPKAAPIGFSTDPDSGDPILHVAVSAFKRVAH